MMAAPMFAIFSADPIYIHPQLVMFQGISGHLFACNGDHRNYPDLNIPVVMVAELLGGDSMTTLPFGRNH